MKILFDELIGNDSILSVAVRTFHVNSTGGYSKTEHELIINYARI